MTLPAGSDAAYVISVQAGRQRLEVFADRHPADAPALLLLRVLGPGGGKRVRRGDAHLHHHWFIHLRPFHARRVLQGSASGISARLQLATSDWHKFIGIAALAFNLSIAFTGAFLGLDNLFWFTPGFCHICNTGRSPPLIKALALAAG
jgi:hypothetical protein